jgi:hypothetical protein
MSTVIAEVTTRVPSAVNFAKLYVVPPDVNVPKAPPPVTVGKNAKLKSTKRVACVIPSEALKRALKLPA